MIRVSLLVWCLGYVLSVDAGQSMQSLARNPFSKPAIFAPAAKPHVQNRVRVEEPRQLELSATLVSDAMPLVVVDGEMLGIGDEIYGFRLLSVQEGQAVFINQGEKQTFTLVGSGTEVD